MADKEIDEATGVETTGHSWDGLKELNNPLPRWWVNLFYATIVWSVFYWILMPAWPGLTGHTKGLRNHSDRANVAQKLADLDDYRSSTMDRLVSVDTIDEIMGDDDLREFAVAAGEAVFGDNCATCHGAGGQGFSGYPNLNDDEWIWGGSFDQIQKTIHHGIRSDHPEARFSLMQAFGKDGVLNRTQIKDVTEYVVALSGGDADNEAVGRGAVIFEEQCAACHGVSGEGSQDMGAPQLANKIWLYGGDRSVIQETITNGRGGVMPAWTDRLSNEQIVAVSVYVHSLGGGE
ncbi:MAG: cytochrome-c oxidase, cbb3-type subunit III [Pseudomonadota bacterium]